MARILYVSPDLAKEAIYASYGALIEDKTTLIRVVSAPTSPTSSGVLGNIATSGRYFFAATGENQWGRALISFFSEPLYFNNPSVFWDNPNIYFNQTEYSP